MAKCARELLEDRDPIGEPQRRLEPQERVERHAAFEVVEQHGRAHRRIGDVVGERENVRVLAHLMKQLRLALGGAQ
jgi:hypothetical protein